MEQQKNPVLFYFLMAFLTCGVSFIGYKFGGILGAAIGCFFSLVVNGYALTIKHD